MCRFIFILRIANKKNGPNGTKINNDKKKKFELNLKYFNHIDKNFSYKFEGQPNQNNLYSKKLEELLNIKDLDIKEITQTHKNIAASAQKVFENKLLEICNEIKKMNISENAKKILMDCI